MLQQKIENWLSRVVPEKAINACYDLPIVLATDVGLKRLENQDRVAAIKIGNQDSQKKPLVAIAVADGMGGMQDGARCAILAISGFFYALFIYENLNLEERTIAAIKYSNNVVNSFANGSGGSTLSVILVEKDTHPIVAHVGDSRAYAYGEESKVKRLTVDDSLEEAVGGHGRELLQFIGMGEGIKPHINHIPEHNINIALTTDGIHYIESATLESILLNANNIKSASERLIALARWCGSPDNASVATIDLQSLFYNIENYPSDVLQVWDPFGSLAGVWISTAYKNMHNIGGSIEIPKPVKPPKMRKNGQYQAHSKEKSFPKKPKKERSSDQNKDEIQLQILVEKGEGMGEDSDDSK